MTSKSVTYYNATPESTARRLARQLESAEKKKSTCTVCGTEVIGRKTCSSECLRKHLSIRQSALLKDANHRKKYRGNSGKSYMEESFEVWLTENYSGKYYDQIHFYNEETGKHGWADFVFPKEKIIIELDGTHHRNRATLDSIRDEYLHRVRGFTVYRITIHEYYKKSKLPLIKSLLNIS
jgi:very-short-patch-repair endonuclease